MPITFEYRPPAVNAVAALHASAELATEVAGKLLLDASQPLVPVDEGILKRSGEVIREDPLTVIVHYARTGPDGYDVAIRQHEDYTLNHPHGGQANYLGQPLHTEGQALLAAMAEVLRAGMGL